MVAAGEGDRRNTLPVDQAVTFTEEPEPCPAFRRKLVRSCMAVLVSPEFSALLSWLRSLVSELEDCVAEVPLAEELVELEESSALRSASTFVSAACAPLTSPEPRDLSRDARSFASVSEADVPLVPSALAVPEAAAVELAALDEGVEVALLVLLAAFASSLNREF
jgi:hypothetical protein